MSSSGYPLQKEQQKRVHQNALVAVKLCLTYVFWRMLTYADVFCDVLLYMCPPEVIRNKKRFHQQALVEVKLLEQVYMC